MRHFPACLIAFLVLAKPAWAGAQQAPADWRAPHAAVILELGWAAQSPVAEDVRRIAAGGAAELAVLPAREVLHRERAGQSGKIVFVLSRAADEFQVLYASERLLSSEPTRVQEVVDLLERARRWLLANPEAAARLLDAAPGVASGAAPAPWSERDFHVARPGPALLQVLKADAATRQPGLEALLDDGFVRAAVRRLEKPAAGMRVSSR